MIQEIQSRWEEKRGRVVQWCVYEYYDDSILMIEDIRTVV
jgi:hypothetical protein